MAEVRLQTPSQYGPLPAGFQFDLQDEYTVLVGRNNVGKSALLQFMFIKLYDIGEYGSRSCIILPDRLFVGETMNPGQKLSNWNEQLRNQIVNSPLAYTGQQGAFHGNLPWALLNHHDMY